MKGPYSTLSQALTTLKIIVVMATIVGALWLADQFISS